MAERSRTFAVIGLGAFGGTVARELARFGNHVLGIDLDERRASQFAEVLHQVKIADCSDEASMRAAGVDQFDVALIAMGADLQASILCTMNARMLGVGTIWVKAQSRTHHRILMHLGADRVIQPEHEMGQHIAQMLHNPAMWDYVSLGNGFHVVNIIVPARLDGKLLSSLGLFEKYGLRTLGMMRGPEYVPCNAQDPTLRREDKLLILGKRPDLRRFGDTLF